MAPIRFIGIAGASMVVIATGHFDRQFAASTDPAALKGRSNTSGLWRHDKDKVSCWPNFHPKKNAIDHDLNTAAVRVMSQEVVCSNLFRPVSTNGYGIVRVAYGHKAFSFDAGGIDPGREFWGTNRIGKGVIIKIKGRDVSQIKVSTY
jgi:hypothetical protein